MPCDRCHMMLAGSRTREKSVTNCISIDAVLTEMEDEAGLQTAIRDSWNMICQEMDQSLKESKKTKTEINASTWVLGSFSSETQLENLIWTFLVFQETFSLIAVQ